MSFVPINKIVYLHPILASLRSISRCNLAILAPLNDCTTVFLIPVMCLAIESDKIVTVSGFLATNKTNYNVLIMVEHIFFETDSFCSKS